MTQGKLGLTTIELNTGFAPADARRLLPAETAARDRTVFEAGSLSARLEIVAPQLWVMRADGAVLLPVETRVLSESDDNVSIVVTYPRPSGAARLTLRAAKLGALPPGHQEFALIADGHGSAVATKMLSASDDTIEVDLEAAPAPANGSPTASTAAAAPPAFREFLWLGMTHIWTGYDHLLFLFALLIVCRGFKSTVTVISCFTLAHSLTLALATLDVVNLSARIAEPAIAASIVFVGAENLLRRGDEPRGRWALTFAFGLIHGFGFASVLRDLGLGANGQGIALPLFAFNLGVETGQVLIAAIVLPAVWRLRREPAFVQRGVPALSAMVVLAGVYWLVDRTFLV